MTHICISKLTIIGSDNGLSPGRCQAIIWTNAGILLIGTLGTKFNEILSEIHTFSFKKIHLKISSAKWRPFCLGLNVLRNNSSLFRTNETVWEWDMLSGSHRWHYFPGTLSSSQVFATHLDIEYLQMKSTSPIFKWAAVTWLIGRAPG